MERDPQKRRVKPVQPHLLQLDFAGLDDSDDDSDFKVGSDDGRRQSIVNFLRSFDEVIALNTG